MRRRWRNWKAARDRSLLSQTLAANVLPVVVSAGCVLALALAFLLVQRGAIQSEMRMRARTVAESVAQQSELAAMMGDAAELNRIAHRTLLLSDIQHVEIRTAQGVTASAFGAEHRKSEALLDVDTEILPSSADRVMDWETPGERRSLGSVHLCISTERQQSLFRRVTWGGLGISALVFAVILYAQRRSLRSVLAPLDDLVDFTRRVSRGELHHRAVIVRDDEVGALAQACNEMVASVEISRQEMEGALHAAREANRLKSEFLANMSHELRTPLNGVIGMTNIALETALTADQREYLLTASSSAHSLLSILNDILDFSKIEADRMDLECLDFNLNAELLRTVKPMSAVASAKGLELVYSASPETPEWIAGDPERLRQVLSNLLSNAIKFTACGEVVLTVDCLESSGQGSVLRFTVADTGIGVAREKQEFIFDAFRQADGSTTRKYGGTGLGLAICSRLVEMMGGRIWVESKPGEGSRFHFTARFGAGKTVAGEVPPVAQLAGVSVLIVDDNATNRRIVGEYARRWGMTTGEAASGEAALESIVQAQRGGKPFPVILVDALMPGMDGFELAERIAASEGGAEAVVLMLTSSDLHCGTERCRAAKIEHCLLKPVDRDSLFESISKALGLASRKKREESHALKAPMPSDGAPLSVLLVEDNPVNRTVGVRLVERLGHQVTAVEDGLKALAAFEPGKFDLVLMDIQMPGMDGFEATRAIRERETAMGAHTPIIAMTAHALKGDREKCLAHGMDGYVAKPVAQQDLEREIRAVLERIALPVG